MHQHIDSYSRIPITGHGISGSPGKWGLNYNDDGSEHDRIYIDRENAKSRRIANRDELEKVLRKYDFLSVRLEKMTFNEQIRLFANASLIMGQHGAGLANAIFAREGTPIIELIGVPHFMSFTRSSFWISFQSSALGHHHIFGLSGADINSSKIPKHMNILANPPELALILDKVLDIQT